MTFTLFWRLAAGAQNGSSILKARGVEGGVFWKEDDKGKKLAFTTKIIFKKFIS